MLFKKIHELRFNNNDIFRLTHCDNTIIVNHDYQGIDILDDSLNILHTLFISSNFTAWAIYKKYNSNTILVHNPNSETHQFTVINLNSLEIKICNPGPLTHQCFTKNYYWKDNILILIGEETNIFYHIDLENSIIKEIPQDCVKEGFSAFFNFWHICEEYNALTVYPEQKTFIFQKDPETIVYYDHIHNKQIETQLLKNTPYIAHCRNGVFVLEYSSHIEFIHTNNRGIVEAQYPYYYLETCILDNNIIVALQTSSDNHENCILETYKIIT